MSITKSTVKVTNISELATKPNATDGLTDQTFKALFDKVGLDTKTYINDVLTEEIDDALALKADATSVPTITNGTSEPTGGSSGDIFLQYEE